MMIIWYHILRTLFAHTTTCILIVTINCIFQQIQSVYKKIKLNTDKKLKFLLNKLNTQLITLSL